MKKKTEYKIDLISRSKGDPNLENNQYIPEAIKEKMRPHLISLHHPMRKVLDKLFMRKRITVDSKTFRKAGFHILATGPRSFVKVARHRYLPGYLVKANLDTTTQLKGERESWEWFVYRCRGAKKVKDVIKSKKIKHFVVADKWLYCLPEEPSPPNDYAHRRHLAILLVTDMDLAPEEENLEAWKSIITKEHLRELYTIIARAKGSSYRPDNISYTNSRKFAFIDTEYPTAKPDFKSIRHYLNADMKIYWDKLVKNGS